LAKKHTKSELDLLETFQEEQIISQATLSGRLGIAAGLVNFLIKRAVSKGFIKIKRVPARRYAYFLTAKGFAEKSRLVADYLNTSLHMFRQLRIDFNEIFTDMAAKGRCKVIIVGDIELIELAVLASFDSKIKVVSVVCEKTNRKTIATVPVLSLADLPSEVRADVNLLVGDLYNAQLVYDELVNQFGVDRVVAPKSLYIKTYHNSKRSSQKLVSK